MLGVATGSQGSHNYVRFWSRALRQVAATEGINESSRYIYNNTVQSYGSSKRCSPGTSESRNLNSGWTTRQIKTVELFTSCKVLFYNSALDLRRTTEARW